MNFYCSLLCEPSTVLRDDFTQNKVYYIRVDNDIIAGKFLYYEGRTKDQWYTLFAPVFELADGRIFTLNNYGTPVVYKDENDNGKQFSDCEMGFKYYFTKEDVKNDMSVTYISPARAHYGSSYTPSYSIDISSIIKKIRKDGHFCKHKAGEFQVKPHYSFPLWYVDKETKLVRSTNGRLIIRLKNAKKIESIQYFHYLESDCLDNIYYRSEEDAKCKSSEVTFAGIVDFPTPTKAEKSAAKAKKDAEKKAALLKKIEELKKQAETL